MPKHVESLKGKASLIFENTDWHVVMKLNSKSLKFIWKLKSTEKLKTLSQYEAGHGFG